MSKKFLGVVVCAAALLSATMAKAGEDFSGFYVNGSVGIANPSTKTTATNGAATLSAEFGDPNVSFGGRVGYGQQLAQKRLYVGLEAELEKITGSIDANVALSGTTYAAKAEDDFTFAVGPRVGYAFNDTTLGFAKIGWARSTFSETVTNTGTGASASSDASFNALRLGVGTEMKVAAPLALRMDYTYDLYGSQSFTNSGVTATYKPRVSTFRIGVSYYFN